MEYPCDPFVASLVINGYGDYSSIMDWSFENLVITWSCLAISSYEKEQIWHQKP